MLHARAEYDGEVVQGTVHDGVLETTDQDIELEAVDLLPPCRPSKVVGVGRNYPGTGATDRSEPRIDEALLFFKPPSSVIGPEGTTPPPEIDAEVNIEAELGVVIDRECRSVPPAEVDAVIRGYTCVNDITASNWGRRREWVRAKGMDGFTPIGPFIQTDLEAPEATEVRSRINGEPSQEFTTRDMIHGIPEIVSELSKIMTLEADDIVLTGTAPTAANRTLRAGDEAQIAIDNIGTLRTYFGHGR